MCGFFLSSVSDFCLIPTVGWGVCKTKARWAVLTSPRGPYSQIGFAVPIFAPFCERRRPPPSCATTRRPSRTTKSRTTISNHSGGWAPVTWLMYYIFFWVIFLDAHNYAVAKATKWNCDELKVIYLKYIWNPQIIMYQNYSRKNSIAVAKKKHTPLGIYYTMAFMCIFFAASSSNWVAACRVQIADNFDEIFFPMCDTSIFISRNIPKRVFFISKAERTDLAVPCHRWLPGRMPNPGRPTKPIQGFFPNAFF